MAFLDDITKTLKDGGFSGSKDPDNGYVVSYRIKNADGTFTWSCFNVTVNCAFDKRQFLGSLDKLTKKENIDIINVAKLENTFIK